MNANLEEGKAVSPQRPNPEYKLDFATQPKRDENKSAQNQDRSPRNSSVDHEDKNAEGTKLGSYVFGKSLGKGTFGKVKLGVHSLTGELVRNCADRLGGHQNFGKGAH